MILVEIGEPSLRRQTLDLDLNKERLLVGLDLINELREKCRIREEACKIRATRRYNSKVKPRRFQKEDLVWRMRIGKTVANSQVTGKDHFVLPTQQSEERIT